MKSTHTYTYTRLLFGWRLSTRFEAVSTHYLDNTLHCHRCCCVRNNILLIGRSRFSAVGTRYMKCYYIPGSSSEHGPRAEIYKFTIQCWTHLEHSATTERRQKKIGRKIVQCNSCERGTDRIRKIIMKIEAETKENKTTKK